MIYVGIGGTVLALDRATGEEVWRTDLKGSGFVNVLLDGGDLLASADGEILCLDPTSGGIRWTNPLCGLGWGLVTFAGSSTAVFGEEQQRQDASAT